MTMSVASAAIPIASAFAASETIAAIPAGGAILAAAAGAFAVPFAAGSAIPAVTAAVASAAIFAGAAILAVTTFRPSGVAAVHGHSVAGVAGVVTFESVDLDGLEIELGGHLLDHGLLEEVDRGLDFHQGHYAERDGDSHQGIEKVKVDFHG
jgi:hypothetical protein